MVLTRPRVLYFLLGELPVEGKIHIAMLMLFHTIWANSETTVHKQVKYILMMCNQHSTTWSNHINLLCLKYGLPCPLHLMESTTVWPRQDWKSFVTTKVIAYHEMEQRNNSVTNSRLKNLNVSLLGLSGHPHPALLNKRYTQDARKLRLHVKLLAGDCLTGEVLASCQPHLSPACKLCLNPLENTEHVLVSCNATKHIRQRILPELLNAISIVKPESVLLNNHPQLCQFILDCTSINLEENIRIPAHNPATALIFKLSRDWCFAVSN